MSKSDEFSLVIEAGKTEKHYWKDLWRFRELFLFLAWRDVLVQYKQTAIGVAWSIIRPLLTMIVFTFVFGKMAKLPSDGGVPYPIMVYAGTLAWQFFSNTLSQGSMSLIGNANLISKVYFPRLIIPTTPLIVSLLDFLISFVIFVGMMIYFQISLTVKILFLPFFIFFAAFVAMGFVFWFSALNVKYRDFKYVVPFLVQFGLYISPVGFSSSIVPESWRFLYSLNPMVGVIDGFRWVLTGNNYPIYGAGLCLSIGLSILIFVSGVWKFRKTEKTFADII